MPPRGAPSLDGGPRADPPGARQAPRSAPRAARAPVGRPSRPARPGDRPAGLEGRGARSPPARPDRCSPAWDRSSRRPRAAEARGPREGAGHGCGGGGRLARLPSFLPRGRRRRFASPAARERGAHGGGRVGALAVGPRRRPSLGDALRFAALSGVPSVTRRALASRARRARRPPRVDGTDVLRWLAIPPGPRVGELLRAVETEGLRGAVRTRAQARRWLLAAANSVQERSARREGAPAGYNSST